MSHNVKRAITLNSASSKFRNDIIEVILATYRLKGSCWRAVAKLELHILKAQNFVAMPQTENNEAFLFVTPRSRRFDFIASRTAHLAS